MFIHSGLKDPILPPANQNAQYDLYHYFLGAKVEIVRDPEAGHNFADEVPGNLIKYLYDNIPGAE